MKASLLHMIVIRTDRTKEEKGFSLIEFFLQPDISNRKTVAKIRDKFFIIAWLNVDCLS